MARRVVAGVLAAAALLLGVVVWIVAERQAGDGADALRAVLRAATANEAQADTAPKQQVVNGWTARDLLALQSDQAADTQRLVGLLGVVVGLAGAAIVVGLLLIPARRQPGPPAPPAWAAPPPPPTDAADAADAAD